MKELEWKKKPLAYDEDKVSAIRELQDAVSELQKAVVAGDATTAKGCTVDDIRSRLKITPPLTAEERHKRDIAEWDAYIDSLRRDMGFAEVIMKMEKVVSEFRKSEEDGASFSYKPLHYARSGWNGKGQYIFLQVQRKEGSYIAIRTVQGGVIPWAASQADMLAHDWYEVGVPTATKADSWDEGGMAGRWFSGADRCPSPSTATAYTGPSTQMIQASTGRASLSLSIHFLTGICSSPSRTWIGAMRVRPSRSICAFCPPCITTCGIGLSTLTDGRRWSLTVRPRTIMTRRTSDGL